MEKPDLTAMTPSERLDYLKAKNLVPAEDLEAIAAGTALSTEAAARITENVIGTFPLPYSIAPGFLINGKEYDVPMAGEEAYVVTSTAKGAAIAAANGGFHASTTGAFMIGQVQLLGVSDPNVARLKVLAAKDEIIACANAKDPVLISFGGGCTDVEVRQVESFLGTMLVVHLIINCCDAMGAQLINQMVEAVSPLLEQLTGGKANIKVLSNRAVYRLARAFVTVRKEDVGGEENVDKFVSAYAFANADPFRAATNNKGVMNGMIPVVVATGNDTRAVESGVHSYACRDGQYRSITIWEKNSNGDLEGMIEVPMAVGIVGGATRLNPAAQVSLKLLQVKSALELEEIIVSVGLAANLGVLHSLVTVGLHGDFEKARK